MHATLQDIREERQYVVASGIRVIDLAGPGAIVGSICKVDLCEFEFRVFPFYDLIRKSLYPGYGCFTEISINLGASIRDFILGNRHECEGTEVYPAWAPPYRDHYGKCLVASNTLQTNFIRSNGFVIVNGQVVAKPLYAPGRDDAQYVSLGVAGDYSCLLVSDTRAEVRNVKVLDAEGRLTHPPLPAQSFGIASPRLISEGEPVALARHKPPFRDENGRLQGDWVDWEPGSTATSFTAFGVNKSGTQLLMASMFEGEWGVDEAKNDGIVPQVMAELLIKYGAHNGILGGGAADTQQFIRGRDPEFRNGPVRRKTRSMSRGEVEGIRGLGAIAGVLPRNDQTTAG